MGEIKSTIDLVMEKTKGLALSESEKKEQAQKEITKRIQGLVRRFVQGMIRRDEMIDELQQASEQGEKTGINTKRILAETVFTCIENDMKNRAYIQLLSMLPGLDTSPVVQAIESYMQALSRLRQEKQTELKAKLAARYDISGEAVVPFIGNDPELRAKEEQIKKEHVSRIASIKERILSNYPF